MPGLPEGTVTFLFADIEGSTRLVQALGDGYADVLTEFRRLVHDAATRSSGEAVDVQGDAAFFAFPRANDAIRAAVSAQRALTADNWPHEVVVRARMGLHTGEPLRTPAGYVGMDVHVAARICAAGHGGQILLSKTTRDLVEDSLPANVSLKDLGEHLLKDIPHSFRLFQVIAAGLPREFPPLRAVESSPNNLPVQLTTFVGREQEKQAVKELLRSNRLITLTGMGGSGKTRLALQVAGEVLDAFPDGVWLIELAPVADPVLVAQSVISALNIREQTGQPLIATLVYHLRHRQLLLVLDNCEHLVSACAALAAQLLPSCPQVKILATSREPLGVRGEAAWSVPTLSVPDPKSPPDELADSEAVRLFLERSKEVRPEFALTASNAATVAHLCRQLDGIPLAIELAAARVRALSPEQVAERLGDRYRLLTTGSRTAVRRQQTLRGAMDWSYDLLSDQERAVFRRLAVFAGSLPLEGAESVCAGQDIVSEDVLELLAHLVDKSLVIAEPLNGETRYRLLETIRQYATEKLRDADEGHAVRSRHLHWYLALGHRAEPELQGVSQKLWLDRLDREHDNLRAALDWAMDQNAPETGLELATTLWWFWFVRGYWQEARRRLEGALAKMPSAPPALRAKALYGAGAIAWRQWEHRHAAVLCEKSLVLCRRVEDRLGIAICLAIIGNIALRQADLERAERLLTESLALFRDVGNPWGEAAVLLGLAMAAGARNDMPRAAAAVEESAGLFRAIGDKWGEAMALRFLGEMTLAAGNNAQAAPLLEASLLLFKELKDLSGIAFAQNPLGLAARQQGDYERAKTLHEASLTLYRQLGDNGGIAYSLTFLGSVARRQSDYPRAQELLGEGLAIFRRLDHTTGLTMCLRELAAVAAAEGKLERSVTLFGAASAISDGGMLSAFEQVEYGQTIIALRNQMGEDAFERTWAAGRAMTIEESLSSALQTDERHRTAQG